MAATLLPMVGAFQKYFPLKLRLYPHLSTTVLQLSHLSTNEWERLGWKSVLFSVTL